MCDIVNFEQLSHLASSINFIVKLEEVLPSYENGDFYSCTNFILKKKHHQLLLEII